MKNSNEVFHGFFHSAREGRSGNVSFVNPLPVNRSAPRRFYSYSTCIAEFYAGVCLVSASNYSPSTGRHISGVRRASPVPVVAVGGGPRGSSSLLGCASPARGFARELGAALDGLAGLPARAFAKRGEALRQLSALVDGWGVFSSVTGEACGRELSGVLRRARAVLLDQGAAMVEAAKKRDDVKAKRERMRRLKLDAALSSVGGVDGARALFVSGGFDALSVLDAAGVSRSAIFPESLPDLLFMRADGSCVTSRGVECSADMLRAYVCKLAGGNDCGALAWGSPAVDAARVKVGCHSFTVDHLRAVGVMS